MKNPTSIRATRQRPGGENCKRAHNRQNVIMSELLLWHQSQSNLNLPPENRVAVDHVFEVAIGFPQGLYSCNHHRIHTDIQEKMDCLI
jgi:hypothetical protein